MGAVMRDTQAIVQAIQENFHQIMNADPQEKRRLIDGIFEFEIIQQRVAEAMAEPELV
jgi:DNA repair exonuclease SbcCD ATPase subunit